VKPSLGMWRECHPTFQLTKHCDYRSRHHSVDDLTVTGSAALDSPATAGSTNSARTISAHLLTYGEQPSGVVTVERRYGPRRLRDDDDDDDMALFYIHIGKFPTRVWKSPFPPLDTLVWTQAPSSSLDTLYIHTHIFLPWKQNQS